jgi:PAS domain S-box-containing protein
MQRKIGYSIALAFLGLAVGLLLIMGVCMVWGQLAAQRDQTLAPAIRTLQLVAGVLALVFLGATTAGVLLVRRISRPVRELVEAARAIQAGDMTRRAQVDRADELGLLATAFNDMTDRLAESLRTLQLEVDERRRAEAALGGSEKRFQSLLEAAGSSIISLSPDGLILEFNPAAEQLHGCRRADVLGRNYAELFLVDGARAELVAKLGEVLAGRPTRDYECVIRCADGTERVVSWNIDRLLGDDGAAVGLIAVGLDVTLSHRAPEALQASERNYREIYNATTDALFIHDATDGRVLDVNPAAVEMFGRSREEICRLGIGALSSGAPPYTQAQAALWVRKAHHQGPQRFEWHSRRGNGELFWAEATLKTTVIGGRNRILAVVRDISQRKQAEEAVRDSEKRYRTLFESAGDAILIVEAADPDMRVVECNTRTLELFGGRRDQIVDASPLTLSAPRQPDGRSPADRLREIVPLALAGKPQYVEWTIQRLDGTPRETEVIATAVELGAQTHLLAIVRDISARRQAEEERDRLFNLSPDMLTISTFDGHFRQVNPAWTATLGWSTEELTTRPWVEFVHPDDLETSLEAAQHLAAGQSVREFENRFKCKDGTYRWLSWTGFPLPEQGLIFNVTRDVTARRQLEEQLRQSQKIETLGTLAGGIAHDFNNLLTAIFGHVDLARVELGQPAKAEEHLNQVERVARRAAAISRSLLTFSRRTPTEKKLISLLELCRETERLALRLLPTTIVQEWDLPDVPLHIRGDATQIQQVLMNLLVNARDALPGGGTVRVSLSALDVTATVASRADGRYARIEISDTGVGMSPEVRARALDPFFTTKPRGVGTGLGLSMVHGIVTDHGGWLELESEPSVGTTVSFWLPLVTGEVESAPSVHEPAAADTPPGTGVLLVEDNDMVRSAVARSLRGAGYAVLEAADGVEGLRTYNANAGTIKIVVADMELPHMNGLECLDRIRALAPKVHGLIITGCIETPGYSPADLLQRYPVLAKPFKIAELRNLLDRLIRGDKPLHR